MRDVLEMISPWLQDVFHVCVEKKQELEMGAQSLAAMADAVSGLTSSDPRFVSSFLSIRLPILAERGSEHWGGTPS